MKIYIDEKKCTGCEKCKAACPKSPRIYSLKEKMEKKPVFWKNLLIVLGAGCAQLFGYRMQSLLRTNFKTRE